MGTILLITGGSRSGKSAYAQRLAESLAPRRLFLATCPPVDPEMEERIRRHREARGPGWDTLEEPLRVAEAIVKNKKNEKNENPVVLVDCLTLWLSNLFYEAEQQGKPFGEDEARFHAEELVRAARRLEGIFLFVTNEVGLGIVPENPLARRYRDAVGRCNQVVAHEADAVFFVACGLPLPLKGGEVLHSLGKESHAATP